MASLTGKHHITTRSVLQKAPAHAGGLLSSEFNRLSHRQADKRDSLETSPAQSISPFETSSSCLAGWLRVRVAGDESRLRRTGDSRKRQQRTPSLEATGFCRTAQNYKGAIRGLEEKPDDAPGRPAKCPVAGGRREHKAARCAD